MSDWLDELLMLGEGERIGRAGVRQSLPQACVLVSVVQTRGSCPRDAGTRMIVTADTCRGTIGGGHLEYQAIDISRQALSCAEPMFRLERFPLGARLGQCCGGVAQLSFEFIPVEKPPWVAALKAIRDSGQAAIMVTSMNDIEHKLIVSKQTCVGCLPDKRQQQLAVSRALALLDAAPSFESVQEDALLYEPVVGSPMPLAVFGAGHVGKALIRVLSSLPCQIIWIDSRPSEFPDHIPGNVRVEISDQPECEVNDLPADCHVLIMTHSHALDQSICERVLRRDDFAWCGLIGSIAKRRQFEKRLVSRGLPQSALTRLVCPIGIDGLNGKHPTEIAIAVAAQILLSVQSRQRLAVSDHQAA